MQTQRFTSENGSPFKALAKAIHEQDVQRAKNLKRTLPMRQANAKRRAEKAGK